MVFKKVVTLSIVACLSMLLIFQPVSPSIAQTETGKENPPITLDEAQATLGSNRGFFTENKGQWDEEILFVGDTDFGRIIFRKEQIQYQLVRAKEALTINQESNEQFDPFQLHNDHFYPHQKQPKQISYESYVVSIRHPQSSPSSIEGHKETGTLYNYFIGNDRSKWGTGCKAFRQITYSNLWDGIDLKYYFSPEGLKYDFIVSPMADETQLKVEIKGASLELAENATHAVLQTPFGAIVDAPLYIYGNTTNQEYPIIFKALEVNAGTMVEAMLPLSDSYPIDLQMDEYNALFEMESSLPSATLSFDGIPPAPRAESIVIDPLIQSTYLGGEGHDSISKLTMAPNGSIYVIGETSSTEFPVLDAGYQTEFNGWKDGFLAKISSDLMSLQQTTYLGGRVDGNLVYVHPSSIAISENGEIYITTTTQSNDLFVSENAFQKEKASSWWNGYIACISSDLSSLLYATYLGGSGEGDFIHASTTSIDGNVFVAGVTRSHDFPGTSGGYLESKDSRYEVSFVSKLSHNLQEIIQSTYFYSTEAEISSIIQLLVTPANKVYILGSEGATPTFGYGTTSPFVAILTPNLMEMENIWHKHDKPPNRWSGFFGRLAFPKSMCLDSDGFVYISGIAKSGNLSHSDENSFQPNAPDWASFITKVTPGLENAIQSTFLSGNDGGDGISSIFTGKDNTLYAVGTCSSTDFPFSKEQERVIKKGISSAFVSRLSKDLDSLLCTVFLDGSEGETATSVYVSSGKVYVAGTTDSHDFPIRGGFQSIFGGGSCGFIASLPLDLTEAYDPPPPGDEVDPKAPRNLRAFPTDSVIHLAWDRSSFCQETIFNIYRMEIYDNYCNPLEHIKELKNAEIELGLIRGLYEFQPSCFYDQDVKHDIEYEYFITAIKPGKEETGYSNKATAKLIYPIILVHGIQPNLLHNDGYNPILLMAPPIMSFSGQNLFLINDSNYLMGDFWIKERKKFFETTLLHTDTIGMINKKYNHHYLIRIKRRNVYHLDIYVSDYSYRLLDTKTPQKDPIYEGRARTIDDIRIFAKNLKREIDKIKEETGAKKVNIIAHSMGGLVSRTYIEEKAFDSVHAKTVYGQYGLDRRLGLPKYDKDVYQLITSGSPHHGSPLGVGCDITQTGGFLMQCLRQMNPDSLFLKVLNYEKNQAFFSPPSDKHAEDNINSGVYYNSLVGIHPLKYGFTKLKTKYIHEINYTAKVINNENLFNLGNRGDGKVYGNSARVYNKDKRKAQNDNLNHIVFHSDHSHIIRAEHSIKFMKELIKNPTKQFNSQDFWHFCWGFNYSELLNEVLKSQRNNFDKTFIMLDSSQKLDSLKKHIYIDLIDYKMHKDDKIGLHSNGEGKLGYPIALEAPSKDGYFYITPLDSFNTTRNAFVDSLNGKVQWYNPTDNEIVYNIHGLENGVYGVRFTSVDFDNEEVDPYIYEITNQPTQENQTDLIHINWDTQEVVFESDLDGDGEIDRRITPPGAPSGLSASVNFRHVKLNWQGSRMGSRGIRGYRVYRASTSSEEFIPIAFVDTQRPMTFDQHIAYSSNGGNEFSYTDTSGLPGESYTYYVTAEDDQLMNSISSNLVRTGPLSEKPFPHLRISAEVNKPTFFKGEEALMQVMVVNQGAATATNTQVTVTIPSETSFARATRYRSRVLTPTTIEIEMGAIAGHTVQSFQIDLSVNTAVSQPRSLPVHFDVTCIEKSSDFTHVLLQLVPQRSGRPDLYLGLYYRNAQWDPQTSSLFISQDTPLEIDFILTGAQLPYSLKLDWGDGQQVALDEQRDVRQTLRHAFRSKGKMTIKVHVTDQLQRSKTATLYMEVR